MRLAPVASAAPVLVLLGLAFAFMAACGSSSPGERETGDAGAVASSDAGEDGSTVCVNEAPTACHDAAPSYAANVVPIVQAHCYECHADAGIDLSGSGIDLGSYEGIWHERGAVLTQLSECAMPPAMAADGMAPPVPTTAVERATILGWVACGAPDN
jgi:uncharacterized membrane protein